MKLSISPIFEDESLKASAARQPIPMVGAAQMKEAFAVYSGLLQDLMHLQDWNWGFKIRFSREHESGAVSLNLTMNLRPISWGTEAWQVHGTYLHSLGSEKIVKRFVATVFAKILEDTGGAADKISALRIIALQG